MKAFQNFLAGVCLLVLAGLEARGQKPARTKVDSGLSVHNYKHPNKAARAERMDPGAPQRTRSRVGIVRRSSASPRPRETHQTPRYARRSGWTFFRRSQPSPSVINPLANPHHYKVR